MNWKIIFCFTLLSMLETSSSSKIYNVDPSGYVLYCPCMGRFGNQADHFLGSLAFAKALDRTLALPPWVEYRYGEPKSVQVPFTTYFKIEPLESFHKVMPMEDFMEQIAPTVWPPGNRTVFCYMPRGNPDSESCNAKEGNPFGPFWDTFDVDFNRSVFYGPLNYDVIHHNMGDAWRDKYSSEDYPVLAFTGAPASFPVQEENRRLHRYLEWSDDIDQRAEEFIRNALPKGAFIGIHLRNGPDWERACEHIDSTPSLFAAAQCLGYRNEYGRATQEMCLPSRETILQQTRKAIKDYSAKSIFVASDSDHMIDELKKEFKRMNVSVHRMPNPVPQVDLAILGRSNYFIANCISSFSAFAKRERDIKGIPSGFWAFPQKPQNIQNSSSRSDEL
ncbi:GDP-fucose protein O-fucosyltransferase 1-like [Artemia franciscana]